MRWSNWAAMLWVALSCMTLSRVAAAGPSNADRQAALKLGGEALDLFAAGDFAAALDKFQKADGILPAPTLKLHVARCLDKLDRMKESADVYREVISMELPASAPAVHREARKQAVPELADVLKLTPSVRVTVKGPGAGEAGITMDGEPVADAQLGEKLSLDPGHYRFEAHVGDRHVSREIDLERGQDERVVLYLPAESASAEPRVVPQDEGNGGLFRTLGWTAVAVGGAGLSLGSIMGVLVLTGEDDLLARCPNRQCPTAAHDDARTFETQRILTTTGLVIGGVGLAAGVTILLVAPRAPDGALEGRASAGVRPLIGPTSLGVEGWF